MPEVICSSRLKKDCTDRPASQAERTRSTSTNVNKGLRKSLSYQNLKTPSVKQADLGEKPLKRPTTARQRFHGSAANLPGTNSNKSGPVKGEPFQSHLNPFNGQKSRSNAHRISVNSDLLSRIEREKKQYEARISELTQVTENRKMEIEKLTFEVRRSKEETSKALSLIEDLRQENNQLRSELSSYGGACKRDGDHASPVESNTSLKQSGNPLASLHRKLAVTSSSPPESLGTTTRLTPGGVTAVTGTVTVSSVSSDWNDATLSLDLCSNLDYGTTASLDTEVDTQKTKQASHPSVATLQGRLLQMEEANYTTNEELQATLQELWDLQRSVDEAHEETYNLASERDILLEALSTQTCKLEHCRFQIEQLKYLLLTDRNAQISGTRENHFCELYASVEHEKQVLLGQNNDLAQSSDSLAKECRILTEKASLLQDNFDSLETEHASLKSAYESLCSEVNTFKGRSDTSAIPGPRIVVQQPSEDVIDSPVDCVTESMTTCHVCGSENVSRLQLELQEIRHQYNETRQQFELLQAERERETTEWRLYERDLLKTVQVADGIKLEAEAELLKLKKDNEALKIQVERLTRDVASLTGELSLSTEKLKQLSKMEISPTKPLVRRCDSEQFETTNRISDGNCVQVSNEMNGHRITGRALSNTASTDSSFITRSNSLVGSYSHHRPTSFNHASHMHACSGSPGAPVRPSCLTSGPTVRSLIQSIENRVKVVQHQKRGLSSNQPSSLSTSTDSPAYHLFSCSTGAVRSNVSVAIGLVSPTTVYTTARLKHQSNRMTSGGNGSIKYDKENTLAPGGPESHPPPSLEFATSPGKLDDMTTRSRSHTFCKSKSTDSTMLPDRTLPGDATEITSGIFGSSRGKKPLHVVDPNSSGNASQSLSANSKHSSLEHSLSPSARIDLSGSRRHSSENNPVKYNCVAEVAETSPPSVSAAAEPLPSSDLTTTTTTAPLAFTNVHQVWQDPLQELARRTRAGSKRNALLLWCKSRIDGYRGVEVTNFSSSWNNGLALCALLHTYMPSEIPWNDLVTPNGLPVDKRRCFEVAFRAAESVGIPTTPRLQDTLSTDRPDWNAVMSYVTSIYRRYEAPAVSNSSSVPSVAT